ncbi:helix-turn-helix domain-containing protein [Chitinophaga pendula]|uniref:helix-turn-helix domain-containing protein n=1 Tax=Chitinophaga TaxID=79328 RepID=UPI000BB04F45|nr:MULTISPECIES: helix-turn-helix domain-containing protein [Chitinophaga]ASZ13910.1 AraC family transcriptional regulator [Chitinophaga sp. MD30]UCJ08472.1 helix-turn-helix domain-containing protein [Chitinophaga pendula]
MEKKAPLRISSISELHDILRFPKPVHPLISLGDNSQIPTDIATLDRPFFLNFYKISYKYSTTGKMGYGQGYYDFNEGGMMFTAPNQLLSAENGAEYYGYTLLFHPDFIRNYPLGNTIKKYGFFSYDTNEALHLSEKEKNVMMGLFENIRDELNTSIDEISQDVLVSYIEVLLNYSNRFYKRQFITRKAVNNDILAKVEHLLDDYFSGQKSLAGGLPTVEYLAAQINLSSRYLSDVLRSLTGQNTQQLIHEKLIEKAKEKLSSTVLSISEIAYELGFEHPQSFSKLFKAKTHLSPVEFRQSFN